jgi:hypothetical protein
VKDISFRKQEPELPSQWYAHCNVIEAFSYWATINFQICLLFLEGLPPLKQIQPHHQDQRILMFQDFPFDNVSLYVENIIHSNSKFYTGKMENESGNIKH